MSTKGQLEKIRKRGVQQLYWSVFKTLLLTSLINGDNSAHGQYQKREEFQCQEEGYYPDPYNCQIYYRCVDWGNGNPLQKFDFECGPGTVFSHEKGDICVHPHESECREYNELGNDLDSNMNYPEYNDVSSPNYEQSSYGPQNTSPSYEPSYPQSNPSSTESPSANEIDQSPYLSSTQSPPQPQTSPVPSTTVRPMPTNNNIPHPISTTTVIPDMAAEQSECQQEGFIANPNDCKKFFRCVDNGQGSYLKYDFTCGEGTVWDPSIEGCNHDWAVERDGCSSSPQDGGGDSNGQDINQSPSGGENGNNYMTPMQSEPTGISPTSSYQPPQSSSSYPDTSMTTENPTSVDSTTPCNPTTQPTSSTPSNVSSSPSGANIDNASPIESSSMPPNNTDSSSSSCTEEGFFADPDNCMKFYRCVEQDNSLTKYEFTCGEGTAWDQSIESCNHIYAVPNCGEKGNMNGSMTDTSEVDEMNPTSEATKKPETSTNGNQTDATNSSDSSTNPGGTNTSPASNENTPSTEETTDAPTPAQSPLPTTTGPSSVEETSATSPITDSSDLSTVQQESSPSMPEQSSQAPTSQPEPSSSMPEQSSQTSTSQPEPSSSMPEQSSQMPTSQPESSPSMPEQSSQAPTSQPEPSSSMPEQSSQMPTSQPESSSLMPEESPASTTSQQDSTSSTTAAPMPSKKPSSDSQCQEEGFFPDPNDCRKFYRCVRSDNNKFIKYSFDCASGTAWDQSLLTCNYIDQVMSCGSEINEIPSNSEKPEKTSMKPAIESMATTAKQEPGNEIDASSTPSTTEKEISSTTPSSSSSTLGNSTDGNESTSESPNTQSTKEMSASSDCSTAKPSNNGIICNEAGFYANPTHCDKFYRCVDSGNGFNVYHFDCAPGTIFDPSISVCNYPESVYPARNCGDGDATSTEANTSNAPGTTMTATMTNPTDITDASTETPTSTDTSSEPGIQTTEDGETSTELTTEQNMQESTSEPMATEQNTQESTSEPPTTEESTQASTMESTGTTDCADKTETTGGESTTNPTTDPGTTEQTQESTMSTETSMTESTTDMTETSTAGNQESTSTPESTTTEVTGSNNGMMTPCQIGNLTDEQILLVCPTGFRRHPKYCNMFYQCSTENDMKIKISVLACPDGTIYDEQKIQCSPESESSQPCDTQMASTRLYRQLENAPISPVRVRRSSLCPGEGHYPYEKGCSSAFYKCKKNSRNELQGYLYKCPTNFVYWSVSRRCERANLMPVCSREKYEANERMHLWEKRWELPIEKSNLAARMIKF